VKEPFLNTTIVILAIEEAFGYESGKTGIRLEDDGGGKEATLS
jgi:hypothetical protein